MAAPFAQQADTTLSHAPATPPGPTDGLGALLELALEATAATGAALLAPDRAGLLVLRTRGANAPAPDERISLEGTIAGEAWYRGRLVTGPEPPPRGRQAALWQDERTVDVMAVPLLSSGRPVGVFVLYHRHLGHFRRSDASTLNRLAALAVGLWDDRASPDPDPRVSPELRAAARMAGLAAKGLTESEVWSEVARTAAALLDATSARLSLLEGSDLVCQAGTGRFAGSVGRSRPADFGFEGVAGNSPDGVLAAEWSVDSGAAGSASWIRSLIAVPLRRLDVIGILTVADETAGRFSERDREALLRFGSHAAAALNEARLAADTERHVSENRVATQLASALAAVEDTPELRRTIVRELRTVFQAEAVQLSESVQDHMAVTAVDGEPELAGVPPLPGAPLLCGHAIPNGAATHRCALATGKTYLLAARLGQVTWHPGSLQVVRRQRSFDRYEEDLLRRLTEVAEVALLSRMANVRLSQYADRIRSVAEVSATLHQSLRPTDALSQAAETLRRALGIDTVRIGLVDEVWQELVFPIDRRGAEVHDGYRRPLGRGLLEEVCRTGRSWFLPCRAAEEMAEQGLSLDTAPRCFAAAPLRTRGTITGLICIEENRDNAFEAEDVRILEIVARQLGVTLENLESLEEERRQRITAEWLRQMARTATDPLARPGQVFELAVDAAFQGLGGLAALVECVPGDGTRMMTSHRGQAPSGLADIRPLAGSLSGWMMEEQGAVFTSANLSEDPRLSPEFQALAGTISLAAVPIWCDHRIVAVLALARQAGGSFAVGEVERLAQIGDHAGAGYQTARAGEALRESEERFRRLFSAATDAILTLDQGGRITSLNEAAERLWNVAAPVVIGARWETTLLVENPAVVGEQIARASTGECCNFEVILRRSGGEPGVVAMSISPLVEDGRTTAVLAIARDVSDQRRVQAQLLQAEKMSAIGQLVGGMAHEINNPLASILVNMELLLSDAKDAGQQETLQAIKTEADRAAQIVRNLLTYVRGQGAERVLMDLRDSVQGAVALRRNQLLNQQIQVELELPAEPVLVFGNRINLQQVVMNLLVNAEHAIRSDRGRGQVWLRLTGSGGQAMFLVEDDGPGIPPELLSRVFDPFYTTKPEGEGTGLGLSVSAGIVADHKGRITASGRPGGGARFVVELPLRSEPPRGPIEELSRPSPPSGVQARKGRILVVDDEPDIRRSISKFLTRSGWQVDLADSGEEGLRQLEAGEFDVVLCDLRMPGMSGHEFYRELQADASPAVGRLIFMTGDVVSPEASHFLEDAGRPVLSKPFALKDLTELLALVAPA